MTPAMNYATLCESCTRCKLVVSGTGSRFYLCTLSQTDRRFPKYPPQPVVRCVGHDAHDDEKTLLPRGEGGGVPADG